MSVSFLHRHPGPELMDRDDIPEKDLYRNYKELHSVNKRLGGYRITLKGLSHFLNRQPLSVLDMGCGGGDMLKEVAMFGRKRKLRLQLTGVDISEAAINYSRKNGVSFPEMNFLKDDVFNHLRSGEKYDVIMSTLFFHHFSDEKVKELLQLMRDGCNKGFIINDLQRNSIAYYSISLITRLISQSYLVKNDAPLSVLRSFRKAEWENLAAEAQVKLNIIQWEWAFRYLLLYKKQ